MGVALRRCTRTTKSYSGRPRVVCAALPRPRGERASLGPTDRPACVMNELRVENLLLIEHAELELAPGLDVPHGEIGAGKTVLARDPRSCCSVAARGWGIVRPGCGRKSAYVRAASPGPRPRCAASVAELLCGGRRGGCARRDASLTRGARAAYVSRPLGRCRGTAPLGTCLWNDGTARRPQADAAVGRSWRSRPFPPASSRPRAARPARRPPRAARGECRARGSCEEPAGAASVESSTCSIRARRDR